MEALPGGVAQTIRLNKTSEWENSFWLTYLFGLLYHLDFEASELGLYSSQSGDMSYVYVAQISSTVYLAK